MKGRRDAKHYLDPWKDLDLEERAQGWMIRTKRGILELDLKFILLPPPPFPLDLLSLYLP